MTKEEAMIAYVEEMKKIIETMPMTEKVEELLHVIGPFYEIVEDKKNSKSSDLTSDLGNVLTSSNAKAVNGKAESSDSGAESEEEEAQEELKGAEQSGSDDKKMMTKSTDKNLEIIVTNGYKDSFAQDSDIHTDSSRSARRSEDKKPTDQSSQQTGNTVLCVHQDTNEDPGEDASGVHHLTSDSDSEVYCDSMEQFGQEEYYLGGDPAQHLEGSGFCEDAQLSPGNGSIGKMQMRAVKGKGEVKHGGEDGRSSSGTPHREKRGGESEDISGVRRGRGV